jgi:hypothetical protein
MVKWLYGYMAFQPFSHLAIQPSQLPRKSNIPNPNPKPRTTPGPRGADAPKAFRASVIETGGGATGGVNWEKRKCHSFEVPIAVPAAFVTLGEGLPQIERPAWRGQVPSGNGNPGWGNRRSRGAVLPFHQIE